ncbi:hypothetical protein C1I92_24300 [Jiangella anatolica]|uniref:Bacterial Ig-like domain-containing protein n=1 Tax=Jiangella anatolica TaxID=2670374 RepID=A0A2W2B002_9ACTN|nr:hypothetical protein C1I92_24300 [Jiangella anatolica]
MAAAAGLMVAMLTAGLTTRADASPEPPELATLTATPAGGLWADGGMEAELVAEGLTWGTSSSMEIRTLSEPGVYTYSPSTFLIATPLIFLGDPPKGFASHVLGGLQVGLVEPGSYEIVLFAADPSGAVWTPTASAWLTWDDTGWQITPDEPTATLTSVNLRTEVDGAAADTVPLGEPVDVIATTTPAEAPGSVEVFAEDPNDPADQPVSLGTATVSNGSATVTVDDLEAGAYALTATFEPSDEEFAESSTTSAIPLTVEAPDAVQTTTTLAVTPESPVEPGTAVTLTATVAPADAVGQVQFRVDGEPFEDPVALESGTAVLTTSELPEGELELRAAFAPTDELAFTDSTSAPVTYTVGEGDPGPQITAADAEGNPLGTNPTLADGQVVTLTAPGYQADEAVTVTLDPEGDEPQQLGDPIAADDEGTVTTEFTAANLAPGQHQLDFAAASQTLSWQFQIADPAGSENGDDGTEAGGDAAGGTDTGGAAGAAGGAAGGSSGGSGSLAQTGVFLVGPAVLLGLAAVSAGYAFVRRGRRDELLTFDEP